VTGLFLLKQHALLQLQEVLQIAVMLLMQLRLKKKLHGKHQLLFTQEKLILQQMKSNGLTNHLQQLLPHGIIILVLQ